MDVGLLHPGNAVRVEAWINLDPSANKGFHSAVSRWDGSYESDINQQVSGNLGNFVLRNQAHAFGPAATTAPVTRGAWHHMVGILNAGTVTVDLDGVQGTSPPITGVLQDAGPSQDRILIGATRDDFASSFNLTGLIDEVAIYNYALTRAQIDAHLSNTSAAQSALVLPLL